MSSAALRGAALALCALLLAAAAQAARVSDVRSTRHNLSAASGNTVRAASENQVCVFCHTPHGSTTRDGQGNAVQTPLWNRRLSAATYTPYTSSTMDATVIQGQLDQPGGSSKLCLSCHDGTLAIGQVNVLNGRGSATTEGSVNINMVGVGTNGVMPGSTTTGFTRNLGTNLSNDHPISLTYTAALANRDGELRVPDASQRVTGGTLTGLYANNPNFTHAVGVRNAPNGTRPVMKLEPTATTTPNGQLQCGTCHDPHLFETDTTKGNQKFLRAQRFQESQPTGGAFNLASDIVCLTCHDKGGASWAFSAHANELVANESYLAAAASPREFPTNLPVWKAACLNCHDTHTIPGARRLLREGTDAIANGQLGQVKSGGNAALEETCYQCHTTTGETVLQNGLGNVAQVPNIETDFNSARRMPIRSTEQAAGTEIHDISASFTDAGVIDCSGVSNPNECGANMLEPQNLLGRGNLSNRHAECTDCHNPHRVAKFQSGIRASLAGTPDKAGTHRHEDAAGFIHDNLISGVLRGAWGVEPTYPDASFQSMPSSFIVKFGDPGASANTAVTATYVTREYQICFKCHSNYGYSDDNVYPNSTNRPQLGGTGLTPANANGHSNFTSYTNQAKEFQAPAGHDVAAGSVSLGTAAGASATYNANNHRSWHPVMRPTGRTNRPGDFRAPFNNSGTGGQAGRLGVQTMYCSDCHGSNTAAGTAMPSGNTNTSEDGSPWGPHGSANNFLLKGLWDTSTDGGQANALCFKCHEQQTYAPTNGGGGTTGFSTGRGDGHFVHSARDRLSRTRCNWCHVAVPHGWKNRGLLVNKNDVGPEAGLAANTEVANTPYSNGPYYRNAMNKVISFPSGQWSDTNCGSRAGTSGTGKNWMTNVCSNPP